MKWCAARLTEMRILSLGAHKMNIFNILSKVCFYLLIGIFLTCVVGAFMGGIA